MCMFIDLLQVWSKKHECATADSLALCPANPLNLPKLPPIPVNLVVSPAQVKGRKKKNRKRRINKVAPLSLGGSLLPPFSIAQKSDR